MKSTIKILDQNKAEQLIQLGYNYSVETVNHKKVYSFFMSEELMKYINKNFDKKDFLLSNKLFF